jgi:hypothetical protein
MTSIGASGTETVAELATDVTDYTWTAKRVRVTLAADATGHNYCVLYPGQLGATGGNTAVFTDAYALATSFTKFDLLGTVLPYTVGTDRSCGFLMQAKALSTTSGAEVAIGDTEKFTGYTSTGRSVTWTLGIVAAGPQPAAKD